MAEELYTQEQKDVMTKYGSHVQGRPAAMPEQKALPYLQQVAKDNPPKPLDVDSIELGPDQEFWQPKTDLAVDRSGQIHWGKADLSSPRSMDANAAEPPSALPLSTGPRYKRVANPYENNTPGYGGTSMIANRNGEIVDLSGRSDIGTPGRTAAQPNGAVPGFTNQDLVDLYGGPAKSAMTDAEWKGQVAQNSAMPEGYVWDAKTGTAVNTALPKQTTNTWQNANGKPIMVAGADGKPRPMTQTGTDAELSFGAPNHTALPAIDLSGPGAMIQSALPYIAQNAAERRKAFERQQQHQLFKEKYGIDLKRIELGINAQKAQSDAAKNQAEIGKLKAETAALPGKAKSYRAQFLLEAGKDLAKNMSMLPPEEQETARQQLITIERELEAIDAGSSKPSNASTAGASKKPSYQEFSAAVKAKGSKLSDAQLQQYYSENYGG